MSYGSEYGGYRSKDRYLPDLRQVEDSDQEDIVDEGASGDYQLLYCNVNGSPWNVEGD